MTFKLWPRKAGSPAMLDGRFRQSRRVLATRQGEELVLLDMRSERYYTLNETGSRAWRLLAGGATCAQIVEVLHREYDVPTEEKGDPVKEDVTRLLGELHAAGLVTGYGSESPECS